MDDSYNNTDIIDWFNRCLDDLSLYIKKQAKQTYSVDITNNYPLPTDYIDLVDVVLINADNSNTLYEPLRDIQIRDYNSKGYKLWANAFSIQKGPESGSIDVYYYRKPNKLVNADDVPEIEEQYHDLLILFAIAHSQYMDDEPQRQADAMNRYNIRKQEFISYRNKQDFEVYTINEVV